MHATQDSPNRDVAVLLERARRGDAAGRERLFEACRQYMHVVARAQIETWLRAKVDASDLVQQTMLEAYRDFERFDGLTEQELLGWLRRILAHNARDFVRHYRGTAKRQQRREVAIAGPHDASDGGVPEPAGSIETPSVQLMRQDDALAVAAALAELAADHAEVIMLRNLQRLPFDEVASRMGRSRPAVQMLWMRAIKKLKQHLQADR